MAELPSRMTVLQERIRAGALPAAAALRAQIERGRLLGARYNCVVDEIDLPAPATGPLAGIALAHKDIFSIAGRAPGCGAGHGTPSAGTRTAAAVARLRDAGAAHWATLVMSPHAIGATAQNPHFARCINPLDASAAVGGSSSGPAVAVAAGLAYASLGSDTAGSVRIPAATCGLLGLKTTHGLIDVEGCAPLAPSLDGVGILARHAGDAREILRALLAPTPLRASAVAPRPLRLRAWVPTDALDAGVAQAIHRWLGRQDAPVRQVDLPEFDTLHRHAQRVLFREAGQTHLAALRAGRAGQNVQALGIPGLAIPEAWYRRSLARRAALTLVFVRRHFTDADLLIIPSLQGPVPDWREVETGQPDFSREKLLGLHHYMGFVNYLGLPALNIPIGLDARQRPISIQAIARPYAETLLLDFAEHAQSNFRIN